MREKWNNWMQQKDFDKIPTGLRKEWHFISSVYVGEELVGKNKQ